MRVDLFDFELPDALIALRPARPRDSARLLHIRSGGGFDDRIVSDLPSLLLPGDLLVFNDTRVMPAALGGVRSGRTPLAPPVSILLNLTAKASAECWKAFARPGKRLKVGDELNFANGVSAQVRCKYQKGAVLLRFNLEGLALDAALAEIGDPPLPPYIVAKRAADDADRSDYQTMFAARDGAVAAPTAGLHFTPDLMLRLKVAGVERAFVTLHVGEGTFAPVKAEDTADHVMHEEYREVPEETAAAVNQARAEGRRVIAVGTTALRTLESSVDARGRVTFESGPTGIFITPGYRFKIVDALWTNFHLPRSTLFMLVSAFAGLDRMRAAYAHAIAEEYRFYSYGDACLIEPNLEGERT